MLSVRLNDRLKNYLDRKTDNRSVYIRDLIKKDMKRAEPDDPFEEYQRCKEDIVHFVKRYGYYKSQSGEIESVHRLNTEPTSSLFGYQIGLLKDLAKGKNVIIKKGRQKRVTTTLA